MPRRKKSESKVDQLIDELLEDCHSPEDIVGESGLLKQLSKRLIERSLAGELTHHLNTEAQSSADSNDEGEKEGVKHSRNDHSKKTIQTQQGEREIAVPRDRASTFYLSIDRTSHPLLMLFCLKIALFCNGLGIKLTRKGRPSLL